MQVGDVIRITACSEFLSQEICNVFFYVVAVWTGNLTFEDILDEFVDVVIDKATPLQSTAYTWRNLRMDNITNDLDFYEKAITKPGSKAAAIPAPSYVASAWRLIVDTKLTRAGYKRLSGVVTGQLENNLYEPNDAPAVAAFEGALTAYLTEGPLPGLEFQCEPVVVGRTSSGGYDLQRVNPITSASKGTYATTQNSRKVGRGV